MRQGIVNPNSLQFTAEVTTHVRAAATLGHSLMNKIITHGIGPVLYGSDQYRDVEKNAERLRGLLSHPRLRRALCLDQTSA